MSTSMSVGDGAGERPDHTIQPIPAKAITSAPTITATEVDRPPARWAMT